MGGLPVGVLVSGTGTNLQAILDAVAERHLDVAIKVVVSNRPGVQALARAESHGVPTRVVPHRDFPTREAFDTALVATLRDAGVEWVVLAGFMRLLTRTMLEAFPMRIVNIHPALLPAFPGVDAQEQALEYGVKISGCTVHLVDEGTDTGPIVLQRAVAVRDDDDAAALRSRILAEEHGALVEALGLIAAGRLAVIPGAGGRRARTRILPP